MAGHTHTEPGHPALTAVDRLGLRLSTMLSAPQVQQARCLVVHRLDTDDADAWHALLELIEHSEGVRLTRHAEGCVTISWQAASEADQRLDPLAECRPVDKLTPP